MFRTLRNLLALNSARRELALGRKYLEGLKETVSHTEKVALPELEDTVIRLENDLRFQNPDLLLTPTVWKLRVSLWILQGCLVGALLFVILFR